MPTYPKASSDVTKNNEMCETYKEFKRSMKDGLFFFNAKIKWGGDYFCAWHFGKEEVISYKTFSLKTR